MSDVSIEKKLELIRSIREADSRNRSSLKQQQSILYGGKRGYSYDNYVINDGSGGSPQAKEIFYARAALPACRPAVFRLCDTGLYRRGMVFCQLLQSIFLHRGKLLFKWICFYQRNHVYFKWFYEYGKQEMRT